MDNVRTNIVITMSGENNLENKNRWKEWLDFSVDFISQTGFSPTHIGIVSEKVFKSGNIIDFTRAKKRIEKAIENDIIKDIELYSLPKKFKQALFDYYALTIKEEIDKNTIISIIVRSDIFKNLNKTLLIEKMKKCINFKEGEIFEISYPENPLMYISKLNDQSYYQTLNIIEKLK